MSLSTGDNPIAGQLSATTSATYLGITTPCIAVLVQNDPGSKSVAPGSKMRMSFQPTDGVVLGEALQRKSA